MCFEKCYYLCGVGATYWKPLKAACDVAEPEANGLFHWSLVFSELAIDIPKDVVMVILFTIPNSFVPILDLSFRNWLSKAMVCQTNASVLRIRSMVCITTTVHNFLWWFHINISKLTHFQIWVCFTVFWKHVIDFSSSFFCIETNFRIEKAITIFIGKSHSHI